MRLAIRILTACVLLFVLGPISHATDLKVVLLDSQSGHAMRGKLVCLSFPPANPANPVINQARECRRTDGNGIAAFPMPDPTPQTVNVALATDRLVPCFAPLTFDVAPAMKTGVVAKNTCGAASTDTTETGEVVLFGHQRSVWDALKSVRDEF